MNLSKLTNVFAMFSCVGFELGFCGNRGEPDERYPMGVPINELRTTGAYHGASEAWEYFKRDPRTVYADIEHRAGAHDGNDWHLDIITNAYGGGRYDCWYANRFSSMEEAYRAMEWLSRNNWDVLRSKPAERNTARRLTTEETEELAQYAAGGGEDYTGYFYCGGQPA